MLAVTTRNGLRSPRFFLPMVRYVTGIANLTEFYTLTIWDRRAAMFRFTASGGHRQMMWMFTRWSESFWSVRWHPTADEVGAWGGSNLAAATISVEELDERPNSPAWLARSQVAESLAPYI